MQKISEWCKYKRGGSIYYYAFDAKPSKVQDGGLVLNRSNCSHALYKDGLLTILYNHPVMTPISEEHVEEYCSNKKAQITDWLKEVWNIKFGSMIVVITPGWSSGKAERGKFEIEVHIKMPQPSKEEMENLEGVFKVDCFNSFHIYK